MQPELCDGKISTAPLSPALPHPIKREISGAEFNLESYLAGHPFFGAVAGRYANHIAKGKFTL